MQHESDANIFVLYKYTSDLQSITSNIFFMGPPVYLRMCEKSLRFLCKFPEYCPFRPNTLFLIPPFTRTMYLGEH